jgi:hypothetical protein
VWLSLSQLHTVRGVDLDAAPASVIAAALPRLHTLEAVVGIVGFDETPEAVTGFFELLVPRLRVLSLTSFASEWPEEQHEAPPPALPMLQHLSWHACDALVELSRFMGARPLQLSTSAAVIADWLTAAGTNAAGHDAPCAPLSLVRDLDIRGTLSPSDVARVLRAAPQLRRFAHSVEGGAGGDPFWFSATGERSRSALSGLRHPRLRIIEATCYADSGSDESDEEDAQLLPPVDCALRLRQSHFPRLQRLVLKDRYYNEHRYDAMLQE